MLNIIKKIAGYRNLDAIAKIKNHHFIKLNFRQYLNFKHNTFHFTKNYYF